MCVKALIFFTWWQSVGVSILYAMDMIPESGVHWSSEDVAKGIQDYLICIEMFIGAIVHQYVFHHTDYTQNKSRAYRSVNNNRKRRVGRRRGRDNASGGMGNKKTSDRSISSYGENTTEFDSADELLTEEEVRFEMTRLSELEDGEIEGGEAMYAGAGGGNRDGSSIMKVKSSSSSSSGGGSGGKDHKKSKENPTFMQALVASSVPSDVIGDTKKIFKGKFKTQKNTLLHHATTTDSNMLFQNRGRVATKLRHSGSNAAGASDNL